MKTKLLTSILLLSTFLSVYAQKKENNVFFCNYYGKQLNEKALCGQFYTFKNYNGFKDISDAETIVKKIVDLSGLPQNFYLVECPNVDNCFATVAQEEAVIIYDNTFMKKANDMTHNNWAEISILSHEIGHHLSMHTIKKGGSDPRKELEADSFSGFIMYKLGASLSDAQAAIRQLASDYETGGTHPPRAQRLAAIETGYKKAANQYAHGGGLNVDKQPVTQVFVPQVKMEKAPINVIYVDKPVDKVTKTNKTVDKPTIMIGQQENKTFPAKSATIGMKENKRNNCVEGNCDNGYGIVVNGITKEEYRGTWHEGIREGKGVEYYANGKKKYEGEFSNNRWNGNGTFYSVEGNIFVGRFRDNLLNCEQALIYYKNGERYLGKFVDGKKNGKGTFIYKDGRREDVSFINDTRL